MSPQSFARFTNLLSTPICLLNECGKPIAMNHTANRLFAPNEEIISDKRLHDLVSDDASQVDHLLAQWAKSIDPIAGTLNIKNGEGIPAQYQCIGSTPCSNSSTKPVRILLELHLEPVNCDAVIHLNREIDKVRQERQQTQAALNASEELFRSIVEAAPSGFLMVNPKGEIVLSNSEIEQIFGYTREELIGQSIDILVPAEYRHDHPEYRQAYMRHPSTRAMGKRRDLYGVRKDGRRVPVEVGLNPVTTQEGQFVLASVIDVTERKRAEEALRQSEARLNEAQRLAHLGGWELNLDDSAMAWSNETFNILEIDRNTQAASYEAFIAAIHPEDRDNIVNAFQASVLNQTLYEVVHRLQMTDGRIKYVRERGETQYEDGTPVRTLGTIQDITALKQAEDALNMLNRELEQRVEQRTAELSVANQHLQESLRYLNNAQRQLVHSEKMAALGGLVAGIAHEINTPTGVGMTAASHLQVHVEKYHQLYCAGTLKRSDFEAFLNIARESCDIVVHNLQRAADLIRSFKQVAVDQSSGEQRQFDLKEYLEEILLSLHPRLKRTGHRVEINCPNNLQLYNHPGAFSQIITNLVINSLTHGFEDQPAGRITIDARPTSDTLVLRYADNGKGVTKENLGKIFDPFFTTKRGQGGSGLGMHIVHNLVTQLLKGRIECDSTIGSGVSFTITLPHLNYDPQTGDSEKAVD